MDTESVVVYIDAEIEDLIPAYLRHRHQDVEKIKDLLPQGDFEAIRILGHKMKGSGESYGFTAISSMGDKIERAASEQAPATIEQLLEQIVSYLSTVKIIPS